MSNRSEHLAARKLVDISSGQRHYLDFARVVAVNLVFIEHLCAINGYKSDYHFGMMGVVIFFLLSGFLIYTAAANRMQRPGEQFFPFLIDRAARIFSPLLPCIFVVAILNYFVELGDWGLTGVKRGALALFGNVTLLFDYPLFHILSRITGSEAYRIRPYNTTEQFWTIPIEFWTYIIFAFFIFVLCRGERPNKLIAVPLFAIAFPVVFYNSFAGPGLALTLIWTMGATAAYLWVNNHKKEKYNFYLGLAILMWGVAGGFGRVSKAGFIEFDLQYCLFISMCTFGIFVMLTGASPKMHPLYRALTFFSSYSYSLYLVHNTIIIVLQRYGPDDFVTKAALSVIFSHVIAIAFYFCFERFHYNVAGWMKKVFIGNVNSIRAQGSTITPPSST
jgi:peptidoglycan/LPS O-acetylase OafA/YrhL